MRVVYKLNFQVELWVCLIRKKPKTPKSANTQTYVPSPPPLFFFFLNCPAEVASQTLRHRATAK